MPRQRRPSRSEADTPENIALRSRDADRLPPAILLMGPTASGKSAAALALAQRFDCEIVSVDSAQVYRHMDIGTAKPDAAARSQTPHHLIDVIDPHESYSAARFRDDALALMREITERGRIPLLVGGTMLYFKALTEGLNELPEADPAVRLVIDTMAEEKGWPQLHAELARFDPQAASRIQPNDAQRIQRALEIYYVSGKSMSELLRKPKYVYLPYRIGAAALEIEDREWLRSRIAERFEIMLELGLISEVRRLRQQFALEPDMPSMRAVGYRQVWAYLDGEYGLAAMREKAIAATRQLAKRQMTWLRAMRDVARFDSRRDDLAEALERFVRARL
jgi:tRNA dimethylallyltransferase